MFSTFVGLGRFINCQRPEYNAILSDLQGRITDNFRNFFLNLYNTKRPL